MKIQINKYDSEVYKFVKAYLKANEEEWLYTPQHRLASSEFLKNLNDGVFDSIEYDVTFNPLVFNAEECFIVFRYYYIHNDMYDKHANISRIYSELASQGDVFKSRKNIGKKGGKKSRVRYNLKKVK
jgi:hypothetical protein